MTTRVKERGKESEGKNTVYRQYTYIRYQYLVKVKCRLSRWYQ